VRKINFSESKVFQEGMQKVRVAAIIPAKNEEAAIARCVQSLAKQTYPLQLILVVNDASTDNTERELRQLQKIYPNLKYVNNETNQMRAGAVNRGLAAILQGGQDYHFILVGDADTRFYPDVVEEGLKVIIKDEKIGGICSISAADGGHGLLYHLQKIEYGDFTAERTRTRRKVMILHGLCSLFRLSALLEVGGYSNGVLLEDYDLTLKLREHGYKSFFTPRMRASTAVPNTWRGLVRQRIRWCRGGLDVLKLHGINSFTWPDLAQHLLFIFFLLVIMAAVGGSIYFNRRLHFNFYWHPLIMTLAISLPVISFIASIVQLRSLHDKDWIDVLLRATVIPELLYSIFIYFFVRLYSYGLFLFGGKKIW